MPVMTTVNHVSQKPTNLLDLVRKSLAGWTEKPADKRESTTDFIGHLHKARGSSPGNGAGPTLLEDVMTAANPVRQRNAQVALMSLSETPRAPANPMVALEGTLMTKFVDEMLPKSNHALYGEGLAGDTWRGFEVEQLGSALAKSDPLNFAPRPETIRLSANSNVQNLFSSASDTEPLRHGIVPFSA
jgi:hypothetical protein